MKIRSKLSALGAVLVLSTAFASADTVQYIYSSSGTTSYMGYTSLADPPPSNLATYIPVIQPAGTNNSTGTNSTFGISPGVIWASPLVAGDGTVSSWISYDQNSGPTGGEPFSDANGYYTYETNFNNVPGPWGGSITVAADDTVEVFFDGSLVTGSVFGTQGSDGQCADGAPNCRTGQSSTYTFSGSGFGVLDFVVFQSGSHDQGLDFVGTITATPEPNTLLLLGTGLLGSAGALFRRKRA
jgi:hypothetical protein